MGGTNRLDLALEANAGRTSIPKVGHSERIYAIGDIHGRYDLLIYMLEAIRQDSERLRDGRSVGIVFLGDYIDWGDQSYQVLDVLLQLTRDEQPRIVLLRGDHEDALEAFLEKPNEKSEWLRLGAAQTFASYGLASPSASRGVDISGVRDDLVEAMGSHLDIFARLVPVHRSGDVYFSHAGVNMTNLGDVDAMVWGGALPMSGVPIPGCRLVHGHYECHQPVSMSGRLNVDTGAYYSGCLTAVRLDDSEAFLSVSASERTFSFE